MWRGSVELHPLNLIGLLTYQAQTGQDKPLRWGLPPGSGGGAKYQRAAEMQTPDGEERGRGEPTVLRFFSQLTNPRAVLPPGGRRKGEVRSITP